jgi:hypothetical protein
VIHSTYVLNKDCNIVYIFLNYYGILYKEGNQLIDNNTLTAITLLIAESNPKEKNNN